MAERYRDILVIDLLGGLGDLVMVLPVLHALARRHPDAAVRLLTHPPGDALVRADPAVTEVRRAARGRERDAVRAELDRRTPDLVISTTRHSGIPDEIHARGLRSVTDLWRTPPPDVPVSVRYLQILHAEGLINEDHGGARPAIRLTPDERRAGRRMLDALAPAGSPVLLVPGTGMAVKRWPHWRRLAAGLLAHGTPPLIVDEPAAGPIGPAAVPADTRGWPAGAATLPGTDLRGLAARFAAVGQRGGVVVAGDTGPLRVAGAVGARTVGLFGPTAAARYGLPAPALDLQGLPDCPHRRPTAITEQVCWWDAHCPLTGTGPACMADIDVATVLDAVYRASTA